MLRAQNSEADSDWMERSQRNIQRKDDARIACLHAYHVLSRDRLSTRMWRIRKCDVIACLFALWKKAWSTLACVHITVHHEISACSPLRRTQKTCFIVFFAILSLYHKANEGASAMYYTVIKHSEQYMSLWLMFSTFPQCSQMTVDSPPSLPPPTSGLTLIGVQVAISLWLINSHCTYKTLSWGLYAVAYFHRMHKLNPNRKKILISKLLFKGWPIE